MRTLGIDFGERRIGLAISDPEGRLAVPLEGFERTSDRQALDTIAELAASENVELLVVGEPRRLDGSRGAAAERAAGFAAKLGRRTRLPYLLVDEALTSVEARRKLGGRGGRRKRATAVDSIAAQILLQESLDRGLDRDLGRGGLGD